LEQARVVSGDLHGLDQSAAAGNLSDAASHQPIDEPRIPPRLIRFQAVHSRHGCLPTKGQFGLPAERSASAAARSAVRCMLLILIEAPSPAYHDGMLIAGDYHSKVRRRPHAILYETTPIWPSRSIWL